MTYRDSHTIGTLTQRSDMTGADRTWAGRYNVGDILQYMTGSKEHGIERGSYATVRGVNPKDNQITVERADGQHVTYDPKRLQGTSRSPALHKTPGFTPMTPRS